MRYVIEGMGIVYAHPGLIDKLATRCHVVWHVDYPNGWTRRSVMDKDGRVIYTRWIKGGKK